MLQYCIWNCDNFYDAHMFVWPSIMEEQHFRQFCVGWTQWRRALGLLLEFQYSSQFTPSQEVYRYSNFLIPKDLDFFHLIVHHSINWCLDLGSNGRTNFQPMTMCKRKPSPQLSYGCKRSVEITFIVFLCICQHSGHPTSTDFGTATLQ